MTEVEHSSLTITTPSEREIKFTRWFKAPRELLFEVHSKCEHIERWLGPRNMTMSGCNIDFQVGGKYRLVHRAPDGAEYGFHGEYKDISPPDRITWTFEFEGMAGHVSTETVEFTDLDGGTLVTNTSRFDSQEDRDGMMQSGMEEGMREGYERLDELLDLLQSR